jgi:hypothetical protein
MALPTAIHGYDRQLFTQEECNEYETTYVVPAQNKLNYYNNLSGTYRIAPVTGIDADGNHIGDAENPDVVTLSAGLSTHLTDWRTANPTADGTSGTDIEKGEYARWNYWTNVVDLPAYITELEDDLTKTQVCHAEMLEAIITE